jgi:hypothetical protein
MLDTLQKATIKNYKEYDTKCYSLKPVTTFKNILLLKQQK